MPQHNDDEFATTHELCHRRFSDGRQVPACTCGWWSPSGSHAAFESHASRMQQREEDMRTRWHA